MYIVVRRGFQKVSSGSALTPPPHAAGFHRANRRITARTLRQVKAIRAELDAVNAADLSSGRVHEPPGHGESTRLARAVNTSLGRLETARVRLDQADERLRRTLDQQRQLASDASHELRTPLAGLRIQLEEAQLHPDDTDLRRLLDHALGDVDRLQAIVCDLLLLAEVGGDAPRKLEEIDLAELVHTEVPLRVDDPHPVRIQLAAGTWVDAVRPQISRVLANLLDNAQVHAAHAVQVQVRPDGDSAELAVTDDGDGIAKSDRERVFQLFTRLDTARDRERGGSGLGLAIAHDVARSHNGTLHVEDSPDGGARFVLRLPLSPRHRRPGRSDDSRDRSCKDLVTPIPRDRRDNRR